MDYDEQMEVDYDYHMNTGVLKRKMIDIKRNHVL